jgi:hemerythrin-like domain-containing protein
MTSHDLLTNQDVITRVTKDIHDRCGGDFSILWDNGKFPTVTGTHNVKIWNGLGSIHFQVEHDDLVTRGAAYEHFLGGMALAVERQLTLKIWSGARQAPEKPAGPVATMPRALSIIRNEHRTIEAILHGMAYLVQEIRVKKKKIDPRVFHAMLYYLDTYSERMHHPKEDKYLFKIMRERSTEADALIADLEEDHAGGEAALRTLAQALIRYQEGGEKEFPAFEREVESFVHNYRHHMRKEEDLLFPLARKLLTVVDWSILDSTFGENRDPLFVGSDTRDYEKLFNRIVNLAPPPIGIGPKAQPP